MHSHYGRFRKNTAGFDLGRRVRETGATLIAWAIVDDSSWITPTPQGIKQLRQPDAGVLWNYFQMRVLGYYSLLRSWKLPKALTPADVDAALAGQPLPMASESANFLEAKPGLFEAALNNIRIGNYARIVKQAMNGAAKT